LLEGLIVRFGKTQIVIVGSQLHPGMLSAGHLSRTVGRIVVDEKDLPIQLIAAAIKFCFQRGQTLAKKSACIPANYDYREIN